ncbi:hypothetical protein SNE25_04270 [Mucilaginibacter sabulilitoris]|uniref:Lipocalin-like domain-containing protein n=1 Tax=Mucilaginibacter sabulilitoris TaxID=1173583 RepID=A0ABZ0TPC2_9SPHI|nr:hypothetical protein [Mucilaginibacter sabulilitoris]WPU94734.1 hypothetical protein SNE25_04270 [Mucilaginibacter sabulilitoris]
MKRNIIKTSLNTIVFALSLVMLCLTANAQTKMQNFAGTWILNEDKSDFGRLTAKSASKVKVLTVVQTTSDITVFSGDSTMKTSIQINLSGEHAVQTSSTTVNGIPNKLTSNPDIQLVNDRSFTLRITKDPMSLVTSSVKTYTLSSDGKILIMEYKNTYGETILAGKLVYDKR